MVLTLGIYIWTTVVGSKIGPSRHTTPAAAVSASIGAVAPSTFSSRSSYQGGGRRELSAGRFLGATTAPPTTRFLGGCCLCRRSMPIWVHFRSTGRHTYYYCCAGQIVSSTSHLSAN